MSHHISDLTSTNIQNDIILSENIFLSLENIKNDNNVLSNVASSHLILIHNDSIILSNELINYISLNLNKENILSLNVENQITTYANHNSSNISSELDNYFLVHSNKLSQIEKM